MIWTTTENTLTSLKKRASGRGCVLLARTRVLCDFTTKHARHTCGILVELKAGISISFSEISLLSHKRDSLIDSTSHSAHIKYFSLSLELLVLYRRYYLFYVFICLNRSWKWYKLKKYLNQRPRRTVSMVWMICVGNSYGVMVYPHKLPKLFQRARHSLVNFLPILCNLPGLLLNIIVI